MLLLGLIASADEIYVTTKLGLDDNKDEWKVRREAGASWKEAGVGSNAVGELTRQAKLLGIKRFATVAIHHPGLYKPAVVVETLRAMSASPLVGGIQLSGTHGYNLGGYKQIGWQGGALSQLRTDRYAHPHVHAKLMGMVLLTSTPTQWQCKPHCNPNPNPLEVREANVKPVSMQITASLFLDCWAWYC